MTRRTVVAVLVALVSVNPPSAAAAAASPPELRVGSLTLHRCAYQPGAWCGRLTRPLDPTQPGGPSIRIGLVWYPASGPGAPVGTIVANEGGPGWPSTGSSFEYLRLFHPLLAGRNLLLVDNRGTGRSTAVNCPALQQHPYPAQGPAFIRLVGACGRMLNHKWRDADGRFIHASDLFATTYAAQDLASVLRKLRVGPVDMYGDSYGTWFVQAFMSRHPHMLRSVVLDSAYPMFAGGTWVKSTYWTAREAYRLVCERDPACGTQAPGDPWGRLSDLVRQVRTTPIAGATHDPTDGRPMHAVVDPRTLVDMVTDAGFDPIMYRELDAAVRAALAGDNAPILRLAALAARVDNDTPNLLSWYSDGLYFATSCTDYGQLYDMHAPPAKRRAQLRKTIAETPADAFAPFTPREWSLMDNYSETYTGCLDWPQPVAAHKAPSPGHAPPLAPPDLPVLLVSGDLDSWTAASMAPDMLREIGPSARFVLLHNAVHTASEGDVINVASTDCGDSIIRAFVRRPDRLFSLDTSCAAAIPPIHTPGAFPTNLAGAAPATIVSGAASDAELRAATVAIETLGDAICASYLANGSHGLGLRGGSFRTSGAEPVRFRLDRLRWVADATVSGRATWGIHDGNVSGDLRVRGPAGLDEAIQVRWNQNRPWAHAVLPGGAVLTLPAP